MNKNGLVIFISIALLLLNLQVFSQHDSISRKKSKWDTWNAWGAKTEFQSFAISENKLDTCNCYDRDLPRKGNMGIMASYYRQTRSALAYSINIGTSFGRIGTKSLPTIAGKSKWLATLNAEAFYHFGKQDQLVLPFIHSGVNIQVSSDVYTTVPVGAGLKWTLKNYPAFITGNIDYGLGVINSIRNSSFVSFGLHVKLNNKKTTVPCDTDGDGVVDDKDKCPTVPGPISNFGCPIIDTDGDGIPDDQDKCPTVAGPKSNDGCPIIDTDGDGIPDDQDKCPTVAGPKSNDGCPIIDTDGDGIPDDLDKCPTIAGPKSNCGCPEEKKVIEEKKDTTETKKVTEEEFPVAIVYFDLDKSVVKPQYLPVIKKAAEFMLRNKQYKVVLTGHTDARANDKYNEQLSKRRAEAVKKELVKLGVEASRISDFYFGKKKLAVSAKDEQGHAKNRRVEFVFEKI